jgi:DNA-directed RNA polymerase subunit RPC12/RpoP
VPSPSLACPVCQADLPLAGDERPGDEVVCAYCGAPCRIKGRPDDEPKHWDVEEDF